MLKKIIIAINILLMVFIVYLVITGISFTIPESELVDDALIFISRLNDKEISDIVELDQNRNNLCVNFILKATLNDGEEKYYAIAFRKHLMLPRYKRIGFSDYSIQGFSGILISTGLPYEIVYEVSNYSLAYKDRIFNPNLLIFLRTISVSIFLLIFIRRISKKERLNNS